MSIVYVNTKRVIESLQQELATSFIFFSPNTVASNYVIASMVGCWVAKAFSFSIVSKSLRVLYAGVFQIFVMFAIANSPTWFPTAMSTCFLNLEKATNSRPGVVICPATVKYTISFSISIPSPTATPWALCIVMAMQTRSGIAETEQQFFSHLFVN